MGFIYLPITIFTGIYIWDKRIQPIKSSHILNHVYGNPSDMLFLAGYHSRNIQPMTRIFQNNKNIKTINWNDTSRLEFFDFPFITRTNVYGKTIKYNILDEKRYDGLDYKLEEQDFITTSTMIDNSRFIFFTFFNHCILTSSTDYINLGKLIEKSKYLYCIKMKCIQDGPIIVVSQFKKGGFLYHKIMSQAILKDSQIVQTIPLEKIPLDNTIIDYAIWDIDRILFLYNDKKHLGLYKVPTMEMKVVRLSKQFLGLCVINKRILVLDPDTNKWIVLKDPPFRV